jgi:hypothetical protein
VLALAVLLSSPALAADFAVDGTYGTAAGCAMAAKSTDIPNGNAYAVATTMMVNGDKTCNVQGSTQAADGQSWDVKISCETGDELPEAGTVNVSVAPDKSSVTVKVVDGGGPKGTLKACKQG